MLTPIKFLNWTAENEIPSDNRALAKSFDPFDLKY